MLTHGPIKEHHSPPNGEPVSFDFEGQLPSVEAYRCYSRLSDNPCFTVQWDEEKKQHLVSNSYYVGVDWLVPNEHAIFIEPKLNETGYRTNYVAMLFSALEHPEISKEIDDLFEIKWDQPRIEIEEDQDLLTPLLIVQFLRVIQSIVRRGLKRSYYKVERNLNSTIKGKVLVGKTIKQNVFQNKELFTYCSYDEFGLNGPENRLLKKALVFVQRYLPRFKHLNSEGFTSTLFNYINPAFAFVSDDVDLHQIKHTKTNAFYKEYEEGIRLAKLILKRFGYNISKTQSSTISTPPFWIDMTKLFELYVLGLLKARFKGVNEVMFQHSDMSGRNILDYLLNTPEYKMVVDAKYKTSYQLPDLDEYRTYDMRQISGYARLKEVSDKLGVKENEQIDCLIIYPHQKEGSSTLEDLNLKAKPIKQYNQIYKLAVKLPIIDS